MTEYLSLAPSRSGGLLSIPTSREARVDEHVFIPLEDTVKKMRAVMANADNNITFIRAPVASGKTTLAVYLTTVHEDKFVSAGFGTTEDEWKANIIKASGKKLPLSSILEAIEAIGQEGKTLVIDEAHNLFPYRKVVALLTKGLESLKYKPKILLFSASGSAEDEYTGKTVATPPEITNKYMWYPPIPNSVQLMESLREATDPILLTEDSVAFFLRLCGGHRGIFMRAMKWVQKCQGNSANETDETTCWDVRDCVSHVRKSFEESRKAKARGWNVGLRRAFKDSRAVRVNGEYSSVSNIPDEFGLVLFGGPRIGFELNNQERELTINGFLFPERRNEGEEFELYDWADYDVFYAIANPIMAEYYNFILPSKVNYKREMKEHMRIPSSAADLLARALPYMTFVTVIDNPIPKKDGALSSPLSSEGLPYEDDYNDALAGILSNTDTLNYTVSRPKNPVTGKTDVVVTYDDDSRCAIESIMAWRTKDKHEEHAQRFLDPKKSNYESAHHKAVLTIGSKKAMVKKRVEEMVECMKGKQGGPQIVGLVVSTTHDSYEMVLPGQDPIFFVCDRVAKSLRKDDYGRFVTAQDCSFTGSAEAPDQKRVKHSGSSS